MRAALIAEYLCNHQPDPIRSRLLKDRGFISKYNLRQNAVFTLRGKLNVNQNELFAAVRRSLKRKRRATLVDTDGKKHFVRFDQGHICLESSSRKLEAHLDNLLILSPDREERIKKLRQLIANLGPMTSDFSWLMAEAEKRELSDDQVNALLYESLNGVAALQNQAINAFNTHQATLENLVPSSLGYYESFCGPSPYNIDPDKYFASTLPGYRKTLIQRSLPAGLDVCLQGALRDDLMPGAWTMDYSDDELWDSLEICEPLRDPFALLGALDIALWRQKDERYRSLAEKAVTMLIEDEFPRSDGIDVYELLPLIAGLILNRINVIEGSALRPPYWKRMCAWMQAGFLVRQTQKLVLDLETLKKWISVNQTLAGNFTLLIDLQQEPMFRATEMSRSAFREEVLGRLSIARNRHKENGRDTPKSDDIDEALSKLKDKGSPIGWALPGPLEGHRLPSEKGVKLPGEAIKRFSKALFSDQTERVLSTLTYLSQFYDFGERLLAKIREVINKTNFDDEFTEFPEILKRIIDTGFIACAHRDVELACVIGAKIVATSPWINSEYKAANIVQALLIAGAAFQKQSEWAEWLEEQFAEVAYRLPAGKKAKEFLSLIQELKIALSIKMAIHGRTEAIASAAT